jgi:lipopolysaccharide cholinephosphotransferase
MLLTNGSNYKIMNVEHTIREDLIINDPIPITKQYKLDNLYKVIKYTTEFLETHGIDYCIESGTLIGCVRHDGIIPWDNDVDIMIFKDGYFKMKTLMNKYNNNNFNILHMTPGFKIFYEKKCYGELFVYDYDEKIDLYRMAFPIIDNKSTFITSDIYFKHQKYKKTSLFPTKKTLFEDFYVRTPNNIKEILNTTYKGNLLECKYWTSNDVHELSNLYLYKLF